MYANYIASTIFKMEATRRESNVFILLFHLLAFGTFAGNIFYHHHYIHMPRPKDWAGRSKYLTYINEVSSDV